MKSVSEFEKVSLRNLCAGAASELFDRELNAALDNMADRNAKVKAKREIILKVTLVPTEDRSRAAVEVTCVSKLAGANPIESSFDLVQEGRKQSAYQRTMAESTVSQIAGGV